MKANLPIEAASVEQINKYFQEQQEVTEQMLKILEDQENATTSEIMGCKESIKNFRVGIDLVDETVDGIKVVGEKDDYVGLVLDVVICRGGMENNFLLLFC